MVGSYDVGTTAAAQAAEHLERRLIPTHSGHCWVAATSVLASPCAITVWSNHHGYGNRMIRMGLTAAGALL